MADYFSRIVSEYRSFSPCSIESLGCKTMWLLVQSNILLYDKNFWVCFTQRWDGSSPHSLLSRYVTSHRCISYNELVCSDPVYLSNSWLSLRILHIENKARPTTTHWKIESCRRNWILQLSTSDHYNYNNNNSKYYVDRVQVFPTRVFDGTSDIGIDLYHLYWWMFVFSSHGNPF